MPYLSLALLGPFQATLDGVPVSTFEYNKVRALLAYLAVEADQPQARETLVGLLWPELPERAARQNLSQALANLRQAIGDRAAHPPFLLVSHDTIQFNRASYHDLDVATFTDLLAACDWHAHPALETCDVCAQNMGQAVMRYGGRFLEQFSLRDSAPFEEWALFKREHFHQQALQALAPLTEYHLRQGAYKVARRYAERQIELEPWHEAAHRQLMRALVLNGERSAALAQYERCRAVLAEELGVEPEKATTSLYGQIKAGAIGEKEEGPLPGHDPHSSLPPSPFFVQTAPFVGREQEYGQLVNLIGQAAERMGHVVLIEGEPGIGKSRLVQEVAGYAWAQGARALLVNCYLVERTVPYQPVIDLVNRVLNDGPGERFRHLSPMSLAELALLVPDMAERFPYLPAPSSDLPEARQARLLGALVQLLDAYAGEGHLLLAVDDVHWADRATLQFLHHLARHILHRPVLLICTYRGEEATAAEREYLTTFIHALKRESRTTSISLARLSLESTNALLAALAHPAGHTPELGHWLHRETDGNPFFLVSILQSLLEQGLMATQGEAAWHVDPQKLYTAGAELTLPEALRESVRNRLRRVPEPIRQVLDVAAVLGRWFDFSILQAVTQERESPLLDSLEYLVQRQLLREEPDGNHYDFSHDKVREVVYHDMSGTRLSLLHCQVAERLEGLVGGRTWERASLLAEHYERGQVWNKAIAYLAQGGDRAKDLFALSEALRFYDRAIGLAEAHPGAADPPTVLSLHERRGEARALASEFEAAVADLKLVLNDARQAGEPARQRDLLIRLGMTCRRADDLERAKAYLNEALSVSRAAGDARSVADALFHLGTVVWSQGDNAQARMYHQEAVDICRRDGLTDVVAVQALHGLGESFWMSAQPREAIEALTESLELARRIGDRGYEAEDLQMIGWVIMRAEANYKQAGERLKESLAISQAAHLDWHSVATLNALGLALGFAGDYEQGLAAINRGRHLAEAIGLVRLLSVNLDCLGCLLLDLNLLRKAEAMHARGVQVALAAKSEFWLPRLQANLAIDRLRLGDLGVGEELRAALETALAHGQELHVVCCLERLAEFALARGEPQKAIHYADQLLALAEPRDVREMVAQAHRWRGEALLAAGQLSAAEAELQNALSLAQAIGRVRLALDVHAALEKLYRTQGQTDAAAHHQAAMKTIVARIAASVKEAELRAGLPMDEAGV